MLFVVLLFFFSKQTLDSGTCGRLLAIYSSGTEQIVVDVLVVQRQIQFDATSSLTNPLASIFQTEDARKSADAGCILYK